MIDIKTKSKIFTIYHADLYVFDGDGRDASIYTFEPLQRVDRHRAGTTLLTSQLIPDREPVAQISAPLDVSLIEYEGVKYLSGPSFTIDAREAFRLAKLGERGFSMMRS